MITENDLDLIENRLEDKFATKEELQQMKSDLFDKLDSILKEILATRQEKTVMAGQISNHEDRITVLETAKAA